MIDNNKQLSKLPKEEIKQLLQASFEALGTSDFTPEAVQETLNQLLVTTGQKPGILFSLIRTVVSWAPFSPALDHTLSVLGKEVSLARLDAAIKAL
jgi:glutamyl/glutaminyl-tRNA synthetase